MIDEQFIGYLDNRGLKYLLDNYIAKKTETTGALAEAKNYADDAIAALVNGAPETLDTLGELAAALKDNKDIVDVLNQSIGAKADKSALAEHTNNKNNPHNITAGQLNLAAVATSGSYGDLINKPNIPTVGYAANGKNYPVELSNNQMYVNVPWTDTIYTLTKDKVVNALGYEPPKTDTNTTYSAATTSSDGLMSAADKAKLDGIVAGANKYTLPAASADTLGGVRIGYTESGKNYPVRLDSNNKMYVYVPWEKGSSDITGTVQINQGGTGATNRKNALYNLAYLGTEPIKTAATDTTAKWTEIGSGYTFYLTSGLLNNQPSQYGLLINYAQNSEIFQIWNTQNGGPTYFRSGNGSGWADTGWRKVFDSANYPNGIKYGNTSLDVSMNQTPIIWAKNNGKTSWALERHAATQNTMVAHYYDEDGNWTTSGFLLDHQNFTTYVTPAAIGALPISGGTLTGALSLPRNLYAEGDTLDATQYAIDMNNSNIVGVNGIYMNDAADGITEGIHFYRSTTTYDSLWAASGKLYFTPNRPLSGAGTAYTVYHTGNKPTEIVSGTSTLTTGIATTPILYLKKNGYSHWAIERVGDTDNRLKWHYYDPTTGNWTGNALIIDSNNWVDYALPRTPAQIEFMPGTTASHGGYIDFHFNSSSADHTSRIIESASGELTMNNYCKLFNSGRQMQLTGSTSDDTTYARYIAATSSGAVALQASTNWGVYDITGGRWLIHVNKSGDSSNVNIAGWASIGGSTQPVYFNSKGRPVACGAIAIANGGTGAINEVTAANNLKVQSLGHGVDILANADLNTYTTVGNYRCTSTNIGATIANSPVANAFTLQVYASTGTSTSAPTTAGWTYFIQKLTALNGAQYYRTVNFLGATTATFGDWAKIYDSVNNKPTAADVGAVALNGDSTVNGTITATKIIGAVYA